MTHRVVVINGKTVVDERTVDGKPVPAGPAGPGRLPGMPMPIPPLGTDPDEMLRALREQMERDMPGLPPLPTLPSVPPMPAGGDRSRDSGHGGSTAKDARPEPMGQREGDGRGKLLPRPRKQ